MKAVFAHQDAVLRDSHIDPDSSLDTWRLAPATLEAMRMLATEDTLVFLFGSRSDSADAQAGDGEDDRALHKLVDQIEAGGGRVDGLVVCMHGQNESCKCWGEFPGIFWIAASRFGLNLGQCYVLGDTEKDISTAYGAGARPLLILCARSINEVLDNLPSHKDYPIATNLTTAVGYIEVEEGISQQLGHPRASASPVPPDEILYADPSALPALMITSRMASALQARLMRTRTQLRDLMRWLSFFILGAVGLSLGIAYLLTHLYRVQPFPQFVYYITLQFIPRPLRGALFVVWGAGVIFLAIRSFYRSTSVWRKLRP